jgi:primary-amine oxidase
VTHVPTPRHPLDPLDAGEIARAVQVLRAEQRLGERSRLILLTLHEPARAAVLGLPAAPPPEREAFAIVLDTAGATTYEAVVSLADMRTRAWTAVPGVQPPIVPDEFLACERAVKAHPGWQAAMEKRGIVDFDLCMVDPWSAGHFGFSGEEGRRLSRALTWVRAHPTDNGYARPVQGVVTLVDLNAMAVIAVEDHGVVPLPPEDANYTPAAAAPLRPDLRPLEIHQPEGPSFVLDGWELGWQKWHLRLGFNPREGLVLYQVRYRDGERERPILYRASVADMVVPYGDPRPGFFHRNAFDIGEYGIGMLANALTLGCDCLGEVRYLDALMTDSRGELLRIPNAICIHEEDFGILWKHHDFRLGTTEVRRSRRLVVSFVATVGNYEYGFYWYFYQDGSLELQVKLTGIISNGAVAPGETPPWGTIVAPGVYGPIHQHFFCARLEMMLDGLENTVVEVNTVADPPGPENPHANAFRTEETCLARESEAARSLDLRAARFWKVVNRRSRNRLGQAVGYRLVPGTSAVPFAGAAASVTRRAGFISRHLWVTRHDPAQRYAAGDYPNQHPGGAGLPAYVKADRPLLDTEVVVWHTFGEHHVVRPEEWPVMPVACVGFMLRPDGFFDRNPGLDVPPSLPHGAGAGHAPRCH